MKEKKALIISAVFAAILSAIPIYIFSQDAVTKATPKTGEENAEYSECLKAGGRLTYIKECDGTLSQWCMISENEGCYADQVKNGKCPASTSPRILCDNNDTQ